MNSLCRQGSGPIGIVFTRSITKLLDALSSLSSNRTRAVSWAPSWRSLGAPSATWAPLLARSGLDWLALAAPGALAGSIWPRLARSGCPCCPGWLDLAALCAPGRPRWLDLAANNCPIDTISKKKTICLSTILLRCCLLRAPWNVSSCLKSSIQ